ncbi:MAG: phage baseplate assembly protein V [Acidobacteriota bacterium]
MEELLTQLAREVREKSFGKYRGFVVDNQDPEQLGRLRLRVPSVLADAVTGWALPCLPYGGLSQQGWYAVPDVDAQVWVEFEAGDLSHPIWTGTFWQQAGEAPAEPDREAPTARVLKTASGHRLIFDDEPGEERILIEHTTGAQIELTADGSIASRNACGAQLLLDADNKEVRIEDGMGNELEMTRSGTRLTDPNDNRVDMSPGGVTVKGQNVVIEGGQVALGGDGGEPLIKGQSFLQLFATHTHPTPAGPSGPPIPQGEASALSSKVKTL